MIYNYFLYHIFLVKRSERKGFDKWKRKSIRSPCYSLKKGRDKSDISSPLPLLLLSIIYFLTK